MPTTQRVAVTGTDGTGKTTVVRRLSASFRDRPRELRAFRAPQYHENPDLPFGRLSAAIDALSVLGDRLGDPLLKTSALFLSMTLYGDVERHVIAAYAPAVVVAERQCLADTLTYARFYQRFMTAPLDQERLAPAVHEALAPLGAGAWDDLLAWLPVVQARTGAGQSSFWELPLYLRDLFASEPTALLQHLIALYQAPIPDTLVVLAVRPDVLAGRLASKRGAAEAPVELHEQAHVLAMVQAGLLESAHMLQKVRPTLNVHELDTSEQTPEITEREVLKLIGAGNRVE